MCEFWEGGVRLVCVLGGGEVGGAPGCHGWHACFRHVPQGRCRKAGAHSMRS
jgi:hypothetical protein